MALAPLSEILADAAAGGYAVGYFESWNLESLQAVIDAAEESRSPVIVGFNGMFLCSPQRVVRERLELYAQMSLAAARAATVPVAIIFNECDDDDAIRAAIDAGFQTVMPEYGGLGHDEQVGRVRDLVAYAHARDAAVEAQVGTLAGMGIEPGVPTDPQQAGAFVEATGIDLFSAVIGNVHCLRSGTAAVDLALLRRIGEAVDRPLVLHGGSGFPAAAIAEAIDCGVAKFNIGTALKVAYRDAMQQALDNAGDRVDIHDLFGRGTATDAMAAGRIAVKERVLDFMKLYNCTGKA